MTSNGTTYAQQDATLEELRDALKDTLSSRGVLGDIKAKLRAEIFQAIEDKSVPKPKLSNENLLINELIREYLEYNNHQHTLSVFLTETGQPQEKAFERSFMARELQVADNAQYPDTPLLYGLTRPMSSQKSSPKKSPSKSPQRSPYRQSSTSNNTYNDEFQMSPLSITREP